MDGIQWMLGLYWSVNVHWTWCVLRGEAGCITTIDSCDISPAVPPVHPALHNTKSELLE